MTLVLGIAGLLVTALPAAIALAYLARWRIECRATDAAEPLPFPAALRGFLAECVATAITLGSRLFASLPSRAFARPPEGGIAVLVPDVGLDAASFWLLRRRLMRRGWAVCPSPVRGWPRDLDAAAAALDARVRDLRAQAPHTILALIAHGSGGILARYYLRRHPETPIRCLVTLGTPHQGTRAPWLRGAHLGRLRPGSPLVHELGARDPVPQQCDAVAISSPFDAWILPTAAAYYPGAFNIEIRGIGHYALLTSRRVAQLLVENLPVTAPAQALRR